MWRGWRLRLTYGPELGVAGLFYCEHGPLSLLQVNGKKMRAGVDAFVARHAVGTITKSMT